MWEVKQSESGKKVNFCLAPSSAMRHFGSTPTSIHPKYVMAAVRKMDRVRISDHMSATNTVHSLHSLPLRPSHFSPIPHADPMHQHHPHLTSFPLLLSHVPSMVQQQASDAATTCSNVCKMAASGTLCTPPQS